MKQAERNHILDTAEYKNQSGNKYECDVKGCDEETWYVTNAGDFSFILCHFHRNRETVDKLLPPAQPPTFAKNMEDVKE